MDSIWSNSSEAVSSRRMGFSSVRPSRSVPLLGGGRENIVSNRGECVLKK